MSRFLKKYGTASLGILVILTIIVIIADPGEIEREPQASPTTNYITRQAEGLKNAFLERMGIAEASSTQDKNRNGFSLENTIIPLEKILKGGPPRDGIPAILNPKFVDSKNDQGFDPQDIVLSYTHNNETRAYPLNIIIQHEIVNDTVGGKPVAITYCPLCGTSMVFDRVYENETLTFGVSGLLYNSDVLMYDHQTESLWSQLMMKSVSGKNLNTSLTWLPSTEITLEAWQQKFPQGKILSTDTGYKRNYHRLPYASYLKSPGTAFPITLNRQELPLKQWVIGIKINDTTKAFPLIALKETDNNTITDTIEDIPIQLTINEKTQQITAKNSNTNQTIPHVKLYWFAWQAFYPETALYQP